MCPLAHEEAKSAKATAGDSYLFSYQEPISPQPQNPTPTYPHLPTRQQGREFMDTLREAMDDEKRMSASVYRSLPFVPYTTR